VRRRRSPACTARKSTGDEAAESRTSRSRP
jgi:hypothetical protein